MASGKIFSQLTGRGGPSQEGNADSEVASLIEAYLDEAVHVPMYGRFDLKVQDLSAGKSILDAEAGEKITILREAIRLHETITQELEKISSKGTKHWNARYADTQPLSNRRHYLMPLIGRLLRKRLPLTEDDLATVLRAALRKDGNGLRRWPVGVLLQAVEAFIAQNGLPSDLKIELQRFHGYFAKINNADDQRVATRLRGALGTDQKTLQLPRTPVGLKLGDWINALEPPDRDAWMELVRLAQTSGNKAQPTTKWLKDAAVRVAAVGEERLVERLVELLEGFEFLANGREPNADLVKGLIWAAVPSDDDRLVPVLGRFCEACYRKVPGVGPANIKLGNACIYALGAMSGERAAAELVRLRSRIKFNQGRNQLDKAIVAAAERAGLSVQDLEEMTLPDFGLGPDGSLRETLDDCIAEVRIAGSDEVTLGWTGADGKPRKSVPAAVKADHGEALKDLRARVKEIKGLLAGQRWRLESLYLAERRWPLAEWRKRYLDHPLLTNLSRRLVWRFAEGKKAFAAVPLGEGLVTADGKTRDWPAKATEVSLWHPIDASAEEVLAWRNRLEALEITQPFKQAHREVYLLTDAERRTGTYSNRFAAHIIKQHQLNALCQARGWRYNLQGAWDQPEGVPTRALPHWGLEVEFWNEYVSDDMTDVGVYLYRSSDQVRFLDADGEDVRLEDVPPLAFSEALRDVDLFVGVASVGNDPNWQDGGPEGRFRDYWWGFSFGDLGETAKTRRAVLETLLPKFKIADRCELTDKFLAVRGTKRTYKIHLASTNILMSPNDQYLCIVTSHDKSKDPSKVRLPFEGDRTLSLILSKAFLLAEDDKITDRTILSQINR